MSNNAPVKHIVYLMLENRSLDHLLGWLYDADESCNFIPEPRAGFKAPPFNGLNTGHYSNSYQGKVTFASRVAPSQGRSIPDVDPHEPFEHVQVQIADNMQGFIRDYASASNHPEQIMQCYTPDSLQVINYLAKSYAVSDVYFSSIPTQTNCNRAFSLTGNSIGYYHDLSDTKYAMVDNYWHVDGYPYEFSEKTLWNVLSENGYDSPERDWAVFYSQTWPGFEFDEGNYCFTQDLLWPSLGDKSAHFKDLSDFFALAKAGSLPRFSYLEPTWFEKKWGFGHNGTDYHPPGDLAQGEAFLWDIYLALKNSPAWKDTLLIINFDEHGGTYDHVEPPAAVAPWQNPEDGTVKPELSPKHPFDFDRLGVRVPLLLISPRIPPKTVFRPGGDTVFDHTSAIATILSYFEIPREKWQLGSRTANAATFWNVLRDVHVIARPDEDDQISVWLDQKRKETPQPAGAGAEHAEVNELQKMIAYRYAWRMVKGTHFPMEQFVSEYRDQFMQAEQMHHLNCLIRSVLDSVCVE
ncbi:alkaline phosphatase family protein [uncultured Microbulbifer sp.]|uniref:alkaline phosphatase family protein n=1 Tax=uncultured Microbulbifer sp. TaxID=348147 RepID=UPI002625429F|nr:alkaline phosphatase family protein [uncultured Microbulbifer sp.]